MYCNSCETNPCRCRKAAPVVTGGMSLIQVCSACKRVAIKVPSGSQLAYPICKWCAGQEGKP